MLISELINQLEKTKAEEGDIQVTCTGSLLPDGDSALDDTFETTVENLVVGEHKTIGKCVRLYL